MSILEAISPTANALLNPGVGSITRLHCQVANWNGTHPVGTKVEATLNDGSVIETTTTSEAWVKVGNFALIKLAGVGWDFALDRVRAVQARQS